ncbi:MAG: hypothetical protein GKR89_32615 [Candidatus Latescibacteria bacterium]|nr:hypothetical protein [Candidatus Latescibacterota bacterium]
MAPKSKTKDFKIRAGTYMEGGLKRLGALFLKFWAVPMVPVGIGLMLWGLINELGKQQVEFFPVGVTLVISGSLLWLLARKLDAAALVVRYRRHQNQVVRLAQQRGGRLTVTETAGETGMTAEECEDILKKLSEGGYVEVEVTESGMVVYRFPEVLYAHEKQLSRSLDIA